MARTDAQHYPDQGVIVVSQSRLQIRLLFGFLLAVSAVALARGVTGASTAAGRIAIAVIFGALVAGFLAALVLATKRLDRLEVTEQAITYVLWSGQNKAVLSREWGDVIRIVRRYRGGWNLIDGLNIVGTDTFIGLPLFSRGEVRRACEARGWRFLARRLSTPDAANPSAAAVASAARDHRERAGAPARLRLWLVARPVDAQVAAIAAE
jgi:hypothetical protein